MTAAPPELAPAARARQLLALAALLAGAAYLGWRYGFTLRPETLWLGLPLLLAETWALLAVALFVFSTWRLTVRTPGEAPLGATVAILVPTYNEPPDIVRSTVLGALSVRHDPAPEVWVLDDGEREWVRELCAELGARYLCRPAPRAGAKAGNLNHALGHVRAEYLLILDADHVPMPHFLERTLGYFADPRVAFVQSPQAFFNRSFQHPRRSDDPVVNEQSLFYDVVCRGKDRHNATFWCGSSAVVRRSALLELGGVNTQTVVEDTHTAMKLHQAGWKSIYHHEILAVGLAPEEVNAFLTQRGRWARGCFQLLRLDFPLLARGLDWRQRLHYFSSVTHYLEGPQRLVGLLVPPLVLLTGTVPLRADTVTYLALFLPQLVLVPLATWAMSRGRYSFTQGERFALVRIAAYTSAATSFVRRGHVAFKVTPKGADSVGSAPLRAVRLQVGLAGLALAGAGYQTAAQLLALPGRLTPFAFAATVVWALLSAGLLGAVAVWAARVRHRRRAHRFPVQLRVSLNLAGEACEREAVAGDLNPFGMAVDVPGAIEEGQTLRATLHLTGEPLSVEGTVARVLGDGPGLRRVGIRFDRLDQAAQDAITRWCFASPFGPRYGRPVLVPEHDPRAPVTRPARAVA
ncbi:MAG: glycosyltransferase [Thermoleophilia bacterium]|nr:glycosyltransferase [Thermoleophilia bacterium]